MPLHWFHWTCLFTALVGHHQFNGWNVLAADPISLYLNSNPANLHAPLGSTVEDKNVIERCASVDNAGNAIPPSAANANNNNNNNVVYQDTSPYLLHEPDSLCIGRVHLFVAIHSKPIYQDRRNAIRQTWGSLRQIGNYRMELVFFLGNPHDPQIQELIHQESARFRDIVQRDFVESYRNMTRKHLTVIEWLTQHCPHATYLLKVDDDTFVDPFHVTRMLDNFDLNNVFYCTSTKNAKPQRSAKNPHLKKWQVTMEEFPGKVYPPYCEGLAYIMPVKFARALLLCSRYSPFFWIDDVYVTGVLAEKLGFPRIAFYGGHSYGFMLPSHASENILDFMFLAAQHNEFLPRMWHKYWHAVLEHSLVL